MTQLGYSWPTFDALTRHLIGLIDARRILDIGAGAGKYGALLKDVVPQCELTALEPNPAAGDALRAVGYHHVLPITANQLYERPGDLYDVVILGDVIEHMLHSQGRDLLEFLNYRSRYILVSTPECMPMSNPNFFEGHNSVWRPEAFGWHDYWAHQQCGQMHFYLLRGHEWGGASLIETVQATNQAGLFNIHSNGSQQRVNLVLHDSRYTEPADVGNVFVFRAM